MSQISDTKCRLCRREGHKLFLKSDRCLSSKCAIVKRNFPPGVHVDKGRNRATGYGSQLRAKQEAKRMYGILERQFHNYFKKAKKKTGQTGEIMLQMLECRMDNVIYRGGLAASRRQARQLVSYGHFLFNGKSVDVPSLQVKASDVITVKEGKKNKPFWANFKKQSANTVPVPSWLNASKNDLEIRIIAVPTPSEIKSELQMNLIIEYYSR